jgi:hypothetical protein
MARKIAAGLIITMILVAVVLWTDENHGYRKVPLLEGAHWKQSYWNGPELYLDSSGERIGAVDRRFGHWEAFYFPDDTNVEFETEAQAIAWTAKKWTERRKEPGHDDE